MGARVKQEKKLFIELLLRRTIQYFTPIKWVHVQFNNNPASEGGWSYEGRNWTKWWEKSYFTFHRHYLVVVITSQIVRRRENLQRNQRRVQVPPSIRLSCCNCQCTGHRITENMENLTLMEYTTAPYIIKVAKTPPADRSKSLFSTRAPRYDVQSNEII